MKLACSSLMLKESTLTEKAMLLKSLGFDGMSVFVDHDKWNQEVKEEIIELEDKTGIVPCEFVFCDPAYGHLMDPDQEVREQARTMYKEAASFSAQIGAVTELEYSCAPQSPLPLYAPYAQMKREERTGFLEMFKELASPLSGSQAFMLLENLNRYESPFLNSMKDCCEIVAELNLSNTGVLCDFFHMSIEEASIVDAIRQAGSLIKHIHLGDTNRLSPRRGFLDWKAGFRALEEIGYSGFCTLECALTGNPNEDLRDAVQFLRSFNI